MGPRLVDYLLYEPEESGILWIKFNRPERMNALVGTAEENSTVAKVGEYMRAGDDDPNIRELIRVFLRDEGFDVSEAGDGLEALTCVAAAPQGFDLLLVDWNMPNMDGLSFVKRLREKDKITPVIMVTTEAEKTRIIEAIKAGVNNYVIKPFTPDSLLERVKQTLAKCSAAAAA